QRFLDDEPILARRISPRERLLRWCRRNPAVASLTAVAAGLLLAIATVSTVASYRLRAALGETKKAQALATDKVWGLYQLQAHSRRASRQPGQRFESWRAVEEALKLPLPE